MNTIITIGRQYGSGGREIGEKLAQKINIPFYDKEILTRTAKESGFCEEMIKNHDERPTNSFLYNLVMDTYSFGYNSAALVDMPISQKIFLAQYDAIKNLANEGACVIVGRCADYVLADYKNVISVFVQAELDTRIQRIMSKYEMTLPKAREAIIRKDKQRQSYYNYYSSKKWGLASSYDLTVNSEILGIDGTVNLLEHFANTFESKE